MDTLILRKYFIMGSQDCNRDPEAILIEAIKAGITIFQFREKEAGSLSGEKKILLGKKLRQICTDHHIPFIINNDSHLIETLNVDGIHVGQNDTSVEFLREKYPHLIIGLSIGTEAELKKSNLDVVNYIGVGPIFPTNSKADAKIAIGTNWITKLKKSYPALPIVGIGGINESNAHNVIAAGADGVSVISAITKSKNIKNTVAAI